MDPLFGFIDDIIGTGDHHQTGTQSHSQAPGEYTISYSAEPQPTSSSQQFLSAGNLQFSTAGGGEQVVHVVSENSQNEKQVYVIKLENLLKDSVIGTQQDQQDIVNRIEGDTPAAADGAQGQGDPLSQGPNDGTCVNTSEGGSSASSVMDEGDDAQSDDEGPDPLLAVTEEAVMAMAQSVGVELNEKVASDLGCIATMKLRDILLMALQFSQQEQSEGICVEHFSKAEKQVNSLGFGQESAFYETGFKYAGGVSVVDDGPELDLYASIADVNMSEVEVEDRDPVLNVHYLRTNDKKSEINNASSNFQLYDQPVVQYCDDVDDGAGESESTEPIDNVSSPSDLSGNTSVLDNGGEALAVGEDAGGNYASLTSASDDDENVDREVDQLLNTLNKSGASSEVRNRAPGTELPQQLKSAAVDASDEELAPEWESYLRTLLEEIVAFNYTEDFDSTVSSGMQKLLDDIRQNGAHPVLHILCDSFRDYCRHAEVSRACLMNIVSILDALVTGSCQPTNVQMTDIASVLIEIIILPPPCETHRFLVNVFVKILKNCNELLTWTCTYITEMLKGISEIPLDQLNDACKATIHGALCLANGLEDLKIQVAQEFGWHTSVQHISLIHSTVFEGQAYTPTDQDSFVEEEILKFFHNFFNNYTALISPQEMSQIRHSVVAMYGERFSSDSPHVGPVSIKQSTLIPRPTSRKVRCVFRKIMYKNKEVVVPCRKTVKNNHSRP